MASKQKPMFSSVYDTDEDIQNRYLDRAEIIILFVAFGTMIYAIYSWFSLNSEIAGIRNNPMYYVKESVVSDIRLMIVISFIMGLIFLGLYFWSKKKTFLANLSALIIYGASFIVGQIVDPYYFRSGILIKGIITIFLILGTIAAYQREKSEKEEAAT